MSETQPKAVVFEINYLCDDCKDGNMHIHGVAEYKKQHPTKPLTASLPHQIPHKCSHCGTIKILNKEYPDRIYESDHNFNHIAKQFEMIK